jgi:hypothetical protein
MESNPRANEKALCGDLSAFESLLKTLGERFSRLAEAKAAKNTKDPGRHGQGI